MTLVLSAFSIIYFYYLFYIFHFQWLVNPLGSWDAYVMWNYKGFNYAMRFTNNLPFLAYQENLTFHPDYPIVHPIVLSFFFVLTENYSYVIPQIIIIFLSLGYILTLIDVIKVKNIHKLLIISLFIYISLSIPNYWIMTTEQYADFPISIFILLAIHFISQSISNYKNLMKSYNISPILNSWENHKEFNLNTLFSGICIGLLPGIKNEGLILFSVLLLFISIYLIFLSFFKYNNVNTLIDFKFFFLGALSVGLWMVYLKILSPQIISNDFPNFSELIYKFGNYIDRFNLERAELILSMLKKYIFDECFSIPIVSTFISIIYFNKAESSIFLFPLIFLTIVYTLLFFLTNQDLRWHLDTAFFRLHTQLIPSFVYIVISCLCNTDKE